MKRNHTTIPAWVFVLCSAVVLSVVLTVALAPNVLQEERRNISCHHIPRPC